MFERPAGFPSVEFFLPQILIVNDLSTIVQREFSVPSSRILLDVVAQRVQHLLALHNPQYGVHPERQIVPLPHAEPEGIRERHPVFLRGPHERLALVPLRHFVHVEAVDRFHDGIRLLARHKVAQPIVGLHGGRGAPVHDNVGEVAEGRPVVVGYLAEGAVTHVSRLPTPSGGGGSPRFGGGEVRGRPGRQVPRQRARRGCGRIVAATARPGAPLVVRSCGTIPRYVVDL
mmetsp:Transcript_33597/g.66404  ORF Transcript_33597/g.66404 Transcript_33597/m.66404 type:complete len:230 (-) Transcript_33597:458-1147(-)